MTRARLLGSLVALALGCGGGDAARSVSGAPECNVGELRVEGTLDGATVNESLTGYSTFSFVNVVGESKGSLNIAFPSLDRVYLEFPDFTNDNRITRARGSVEIGALVASYCQEMTLYSGELLVPRDGEQYEFRLNQLRTEEPFCTADVVPGELVGCFRPREMPDAGM